MAKPSVQQLTRELLECREKLKELDDAYREQKQPYEQAKEAIATALLEVMRKEGKLSERYEDFTIVRKKSSKVVVINEFTAIAELRETNPQYVIEAISPEALKQVEKGTLTLEGVILENKEYISVSQKKQTDH